MDRGMWISEALSRGSGHWMALKTLDSSTGTGTHAWYGGRGLGAQGK